ncbi:MAG: hypothetical protein P8171_25930 [Candidatus Thiodiazotropha sp.]
MSVDLSHTRQGRLLTNPAAANKWIEALSSTPGFVFDEKRLQENLDRLQKIRTASGCQVLYSIKACPFTGLLKRMRSQLDGFSVSSLFEARLAHEVLAGKGTLHITTPGLRRDEIAELGELCDTISFNSLNQLQRLPFLLRKLSLGPTNGKWAQRPASAQQFQCELFHSATGDGAALRDPTATTGT